jgi:hypothetical protein
MAISQALRRFKMTGRAAGGRFSECTHQNAEASLGPDTTVLVAGDTNWVTHFFFFFWFLRFVLVCGVFGALPLS